ncbi:protein of unknown function [Taphrina deformans PYCC 5710]|uniref:RSC complex subunit n=1 Tax=Taphrina deformans (strain PYCC 5710 / ATCC 11124 / CBS 356.35 / IMI 108563 / JCM 9778 / NBRC 8474) TaxID=1097556 RepID=R4XCZ9_TAPDE|nr:protein of unknown function [Taphrina deformans PYCC 5710]|eukprot:CCG83751.1 protein of unknown function [Taphrina deformans PYCC 5710]
MVLTKPQRDATKALLTQLQAYEAEGRKLADVFQELPPKKDLPDYYHVVKKPMALDIVKGRARNGKYHTFTGFLKDLAQIFYNAKLYNVNKSIIYADATTLENFLNTEIAKLHKEDMCTEQELPKVGAVPDASDDEEMEDAGSSDAEEADSKQPKAELKHENSATPGAEEGRASPSAGKKRGRPPRVESPDETRMKNILRSIRKIQRDGEFLFEPFEKLPDAKDYPDYYIHVKNPMSLALVKKNVKRKVYPAVNGIEQFVADVKTIFTNAQFFNEDKSEIHKDATYILGQLDAIINTEIARPDAEFVNMDTQEKFSNQSGSMVKLSRVAVSKILQRGEEYKVGDWVYLENPNDAANPIIAQIFRTWQNSEGQYWINVCWYYRPFQTVHRADKLWYEKEVVKTGQYRDHSATELIGHCYVMYVTKYVRGRPKEWTGTEDDLWVCENRYNEEAKTYNKIKAWKSCVPDESREQSSNYDMNLFPELRQAKRFLSPLLRLMPEDKSLWVDPPENDTESVKWPEPRERGGPKGPPVEGNILVTAIPSEERLKEINGELPKPEPVVVAPVPQKAEPPRALTNISAAAAPGTPSHPPTPQGQTPYHNIPKSATHNTFQGPGIQQNQATIQQIYQRPVQSNRQNSASQVPNFQGNTAGTPPVYATPQYGRQVMPHQTPQQQPAPYQQTPRQNTNSGYRPPVVNSAPILPPLPANTNKLNSLGSQVNPTAMIFLNSLGIKEETRAWFLRDGNGEILWFSVPPQDTVGPAQEGGEVTHSARYSAWKKRKRMEEEVMES